MNESNSNDYILIKANPVISDYDDRKFINCSHLHEPQLNSNQINVHELNNSYESRSNGHSVTTSKFLYPQRPRSLDKIEFVPAVVYGPLPFS